MLLEHPFLIVVLIVAFPAAAALLAYLTTGGDSAQNTFAPDNTTGGEIRASERLASGMDWTDDNGMSVHQLGSDGMQHHRINPATGLPMRGSLDVEGNPYGASSLDHDMFDINPANGLPMMDNMLDIGGNPYGTDSGIFDSFDPHGGLGSYDTFDTLDSFDSFRSSFDD
jgi:hypothetical protein